MDDCAYCYEPLGSGQVSGLACDAHESCEAECQKRLDGKTCTRCGENDVSMLRTVFCDGCGMEGHYRNYPGP